jgi:hypothetical protein
MNRSNLNRRLEALEARRRSLQTGSDLYARMPQHPSNFRVWITGLDDADLDELIKYIEQLPRGDPSPEAQRFAETDLESLTDAELDAFADELDAYLIDLHDSA